MLFAIIAEDAPDGAERRRTIRPSHLEHLESLGDKMVLAGPFLDANGRPTGSLLVIEAADSAEAEAMAAADPYVREGVFARYEVRRWDWTINKPAGR